MVRVREKKLIALLLVAALVIAQASMITMAAPGTATVKFSYLQDVNPAELTVKVIAGTTGWNTAAATLDSATGLVPNADGTYSITEAGWFTLWSTGTGFFSVQTYFEVTAADVADGKTIDIRIENNKAAGANSSQPSTRINLPPYQDMYGDNGNWTIQPKKDGVDNIFALGSDVAPWSGPDHFQTPAFRDNGRPFYQFSTQEEMEDFIAELAAKCDDMYVFSAGTTANFENDIPLVVFTKADLSGLTMKEAGQVLQKTGKPTYFHGANIHGNEQSSGEGALAIMYDMASTTWGQEVLKDIDVMIYPRINPDGHQAHLRATPNNIPNSAENPNVDMNRDHQAFKAIETYYLHKAWSYFLPEVSMDGHELGWMSYSGSGGAMVYNNADDMQSTPATDLNIDADLTELAIAVSLKQQQDAIDSGIRMMHYTSSGTTKNNSIGRAYYGHMGSISILVETRGQTGGLFKRRVYTQYMTSRSLIESTRANAEQIMETVANARDNIIAMGKTYDESNRVVLLANESGKDTRLGTIQRYNLRFDGTYALGSTAQVDYRYTVNRDRSRPTGYIVPKDMPKIENLLQIFDGQGIEYYDITAGATIPAQQYYISSTSTDPQASAFRADLRDKADVTFPNGAYFVPMDQVAGTVIALTMEPDVTDTMTYAGSFVQSLVSTALTGNNPLPGLVSTYLHDADKNFPIYRITENNPREFISPFISGLHVTTDGHLVKKGEYFRVNSYFGDAVASNAAILDFTFDTSKFEYRGYTPADGVTVINTVTTDTGVKLTVMIDGYNAKNFGEVLMSAKEDVDLKNETNEISLKLDYVVKDDATGEKAIYTASASTFFSSSSGKLPIPDPDDVTLIDLSNIIDLFGITKTHEKWASEYQFFDYNNSGDIDIYDISYIAKLIK